MKYLYVFLAMSSLSSNIIGKELINYGNNSCQLVLSKAIGMHSETDIYIDQINGAVLESIAETPVLKIDKYNFDCRKSFSNRVISLTRNPDNTVSFYLKDAPDTVFIREIPEDISLKAGKIKFL